MDDLAHHHAPVANTNLKRKADSDDPSDPTNTDQPDPILVDPSDAPRQSWLASDSSTGVWSSGPLSPNVECACRSQKRPRLEKLELPAKRAHRKKGTFSRKPDSPRTRLGSDIEDIGIVSTAAPGPSSGSLLELRGSTKSGSTRKLVTIPFDPNSVHIPPLQPLVNKQTLKELDLDTILRNPQLRHDLLFDPGLQFRPTSSRRKRDLSESYWIAVTRELETGCTCISFDFLGKPRRVVCACSQVPLAPSTPVVIVFPSHNTLTLRMPSRICRLLSEFLEILLLIIQPLSNISGMYINPKTFESQMQDHSAQAAYIRSIFDPELIEQELKHSSFDPSGLFRSIGNTLKGHCAPMRDSAVEAMVQIAQTCAPGGGGGLPEAVKAFRMCMDILELMKLDIANHQLQSLRPFLIRTAGQFELKTFKGRKHCEVSIHLTKEWLHAAHSQMLASKQSIPCSLRHSIPLTYPDLHRNQKIYVSVLRGLTDLVFDPPHIPSSSGSSPPPTPLEQSPLSPIPSLSGYPETLYLDNARLQILGSDATDITALCMFLLLYRQLVFSETSEANTIDTPKVAELDLSKLKNEIKDIGSTRLGRCFASKACSEKWLSIREDIILQIARRAQETRIRTKSPMTQTVVPDERILNLARLWADANMRSDSTLGTMLRNRLRDVVFRTLVSLVYPGCDAQGKPAIPDFTSIGQFIPAIEITVGSATGMEPLLDEIRSLTEKLARLALIHINAYLPLYEQPSFLTI